MFIATLTELSTNGVRVHHPPMRRRAEPETVRRARKKAPRTRRSAEEARIAILDATERRLVERGPSGIRLTDVARDVGVSHPTILHHFGSREQLVQAVIVRRVEAMSGEVLRTLLEGPTHDVRAAHALFEALFRSFGPGGHARVVAFCALEGRVPNAAPEGLRPIAEATHAARLARRQRGQPAPRFEDTEHLVLLALLGLFGEAIVGPLFRGERPESPDPAASQRFRDWLARHVFAALEA
jgi:AcrR family transcriptional regulator